MSEQSMKDRPVAIRITGVKKKYKLGQIGGSTLREELQSWWARKRGLEDPNTKIGQEQRLIGETFMALNGIDLTVYQGEALGIIGKNGAGKSTLLKLLSQITAPTEGEIELNGRVASMLEVGTGFHREMTGRENIYMNGAILGMTRAEIDAKMEDIIEFSEIREFIDTPVKRYSSGMYVKLAFSVAAHLDSEIMIMDEVLAVGDMAFQKKCLDKMREAATKEGRTVLYVSHNMNTIRQLCERCVVLDQGTVIYDGEVEEAIDIYVGEPVEYKKEYVYIITDHSNSKTKDKLIHSLRFLDEQKAIIERDEKIRLQIECISEHDHRSVYFRFEIMTSKNQIVGVAFSSYSCELMKGVSVSTDIAFDTTHLVPGKYICNIVAYEFDDFGSEVFIDGVFPGFAFEIRERLNEKYKLNWLGKYWGKIQLHDIEII